MTRHSHFRDASLGAALASLDVPEHGSTFFVELEARLPSAPNRRRVATGPARLLVATAIIAAAVVLMIVAVSSVQSGQVATAAEIKGRVASAIAGLRTARGRLTYTAVDPRDGKRTTTRQAFAIDQSGNLRLTEGSAATESGYDARRGVERAITTSASIGSGRFYAERVGLAPGPPDSSPTPSLLDTQLGAVARALAAADDLRVREIDFQGQPAWQLELSLAPNTIYRDIDHLTIIVDRASGFPVYVLATLDGRIRSELSVDKLELNVPLRRDAFTVHFPARAEVLRTDGGFTDVDLRRAAEIAGYQPLTPAQVPAGFQLGTVAAAATADATGAGQSNPRSRGVVSLSYRRGLEQIVVTTRLRGRGGWSDPFAVEGIRMHSERVPLASGAFRGADAEIVIDPRSVPHLWAVSERLVLTVSGDLSRPELIAVAEALR
jgi:outer membrane lipoprotein-sorting protein